MIERIKVINKQQNVEFGLTQIAPQPYLLESVNIGTISAEHVVSNVFGVAEKKLVSSSLEGREIVVTGWVNAQSKTALDSLKETLDKIFNPLNEFKLVIGDLFIEGVLTTTLKYGESESNNNEIFCKFVATFECYNPLFKFASETLVEFFAKTNDFVFPFHFYAAQPIVFSTKVVEKLQVVDNQGPSKAGMLISLKCIGSNVVNPIVTNVSTGEFFKIKKTLTFGEEVIVDTTNKKVTGYKNSEVLNYLRYWSYEGTFLQLPSGESTLVYSADSGTDVSLEVYLSFTQTKTNPKEV